MNAPSFKIGMIPCPHLQHLGDAPSATHPHPLEGGRSTLVSQQRPDKAIIFFMCRQCWDELGAFMERWKPAGFDPPEQGGS